MDIDSYSLKHPIGTTSTSSLLLYANGAIPSAAVAIDESTKYLVSELRIAVLERRLGFHAGESSDSYNDIGRIRTDVINLINGIVKFTLMGLAGFRQAEHLFALVTPL